MNPTGSGLLADAHGLVRQKQQWLMAEVLPQLRLPAVCPPAEAAQALQTQGRFDLVLLAVAIRGGQSRS